MPPKAAAKRAAPAAGGRSKRAKTSAAATASAPAPAPSPAKSKRWAAVSASRNTDDDYRLAVQDISRANAYICICKPSFIRRQDHDGEDDEESDDDEEDEEEQSGDEEESPKESGQGNSPKCDGGEKCPCQKPANEHPDHDWILTYGGFRKWISQLSMAAVRCPDYFDMYTFNDHEAYGFLEVCENLLLDWDEAATWQEQWIVCEGLVLCLLGESQGFYMIDDGEAAAAFAQLVGRLFLTMLARLEAEKLLDENSAVKNIGLIMALYIKLASNFRDASLLEDDEKELCTRPSRFAWIPDRFDDYVNAYATKFGITLRGLNNIDELTANLNIEVTLPASEISWGWSRALKSYQENYAVSPPIGKPKAKIGGDSLDLTTWTVAERKKYNFDHKDPLSAAMLKKIKEGMVMSMG